MSRDQSSTPSLNNATTALEAVKRGFQPIPLVTGGKRSTLSGWPRLRWDSSPEGLALVKEKFDEWAADGQGGIGVLLGEPSRDLIDVDLDHPKTRRLKDHFLPRTAMRSGRSSAPGTHYWYLAAPGTLQGTRNYRLPNTVEQADECMIVEYRSTGAQTALPGNLHPSGELYEWYGNPWGGEEGPAVVDGQVLSLQVALLGFCTLLVQYWPGEGGRHEAYLALAGGLLRVGEGVHPYWEKNARVVIGAIADATDDDEGPEGRISEVLGSTLRRLKTGSRVAGFGKLAEIIGEEQVKQARKILDEIESIAGLPSRSSGMLSVNGIERSLSEREAEKLKRLEEAEAAVLASKTTRDEVLGDDLEDADEDLPTAPRDPLEERVGTWEALDLDPYLNGEVQPVEPTEMLRVDGQALMYPGRLNMLYGPSESAKSWIAMHACTQVISRGGRVVYLDFEDEPVNALQRMKLLGAGYDDLRLGFKYVRPEEPLEPMMKARWGESKADEKSKLNNKLFLDLLDKTDPELIVADGMTVLYGLHGLDSNDSVQTDIITTWLKTLSRNGRTTVIIVDHTAKNPSRGSLPIGSQHKVSMVQGALLQAYPVKQPMPGAVGKVELIVLKDRPGQVRAIAEKSGEKAQLAGVVILDSTTEGRTDMAIHAPGSIPAGSAVPDASGMPSRIEVDLQKAAKRRAEQEAKDNLVLDCFGGDLDRALSINDLFDQIYSEPPTDKEKRAVRSTVARLLTSGELSKSGTTRDTVYSLSFAEVIEDEDDGKIDLLA